MLYVSIINKVLKIYTPFYFGIIFLVLFFFWCFWVCCHSHPNKGILNLLAKLKNIKKRGGGFLSDCLVHNLASYSLLLLFNFSVFKTHWNGPPSPLGLHLTSFDFSRILLKISCSASQKTVNKNLDTLQKTELWKRISLTYISFLQSWKHLIFIWTFEFEPSKP